MEFVHQIFVLCVIIGASIPLIGWLYDGYKYHNYDQGYPPKLKTVEVKKN